MFRESYCIQSVYLSKSRCNAEDKRKAGVDKEDKLNYVYDNKFWIPLDYEILKDHGAFFPRALCNELLFELKLAPVGSVVIRSEKAQLADELTTIQLEYEVIHKVFTKLKIYHLSYFYIHNTFDTDVPSFMKDVCSP